MARSRGTELAQLLLGTFDAMVDEVVAGLAEQGHPGVRPGHEFALTAIDAGATTASALGRHLGVSKQAAAKTVAALTQLGYTTTTPDPTDGRRQLLQVTPRGHEMMTLGAALFDRIHARWSHQLGTRAVAGLESTLKQLTSD
ncbi:MarR family transcriptional regulator [Kribbella sp. NPDC059898]|uniref:MarR family transcriptional regulator n=1 Tax=Kribbella sp. NPDC059898 TaxID=3346995 RepID=UPI00364615F8